MAFDTSIGKRSSNLRRQDRWWGYFYLVLLVIAALILFTVNLGSLPLDELQEGTTVKIAQEIWQAPPDSWRWIFPTLSGKPEVFRPPLFPDLLAFTYNIGGVSPFTTRLPSALLGAFSTVILYGIGRELFRTTAPTLLACCVYVTFFPVISQGRWGTLDAPLLCFEMFALWAVLRSRRDLRWTLMTGFGFCLVGLTDNWSILPLAMLIFLFLSWDTPRLLICPYFYCGLILGMMPLIAWWIAQWYFYEPIINLWENWQYWAFALSLQSKLSWEWLTNQSFNRYLSASLYYFSPWFVVAVYGLRLAWHYRNWGWAKFLLVTGSVCLFFSLLAIASVIPLSEFAHPRWYVLPVYPILALAAGRQLHQLRNLPSYIGYPLTWVSVFNCFAILLVSLALYGKFVLKIDFDWLLLGIFGSVIMTLIATSLLLSRRDIQFIYVLIWGNYISLLLFFSFQYGI